MTKRTIIINFSGGKDSTVAILETLKRYPKEEIILSWQDTGAEYLETEGHVKKIAEIFDLPLMILKGSEGLYGDFWEMVRRNGCFPTPNCRECTRGLKADPTYKWIRRHRGELGNELIVVLGIRGEESLRRSKLPEWEEHPTNLKNGSFSAHTWYPCLYLSENEVYERIEAEGLPLHPCYEFSKRLSCWCCIFAKYNEVRAYAEKQPELYEAVCEVEEEIGHKWKQHFALQDLFLQGKLF